jgi:RNA polymerase sigma-70 factor (ECF subfamily)
MLDTLAGVHTQTPDETLVQLSRTGDESAREELFVRYRGDAYRLAFRLLGHEQDALDTVQDAMLKAFAGLVEFDNRSTFRTWLLRIVTNAAFDTGRRRKRRRETTVSGDPDFTLEPATDDDPGRRIHQQELRVALDVALNRLSDTIRTTFVLFAELGVSYKEIAEIQKVPIGTVMSRIHAAREKLQADLDWEKLNET